jgi:lipoprotein-releasing system permease protein
LNIEFFIARRIISGKGKEQRLSKPIVRISILAIVLSITAMIVSVAVLNGYKKEITNKVIGFGSHLVINGFGEEDMLETKPVSRFKPFVADLRMKPEIKHVQVFANKAGIIKTKTDIEGVVVKGIGDDFDWDFFDRNLVEGKSFRVKKGARSDEIVVSRSIADKIGLEIGSPVVMYFIQKPPRVRKFKVCGIYQTGLEEFDDKFVLGDISHIQKLNDWDSTQVAGFEVMTNNFNDLDKVSEMVYDNVDPDMNVRTIKEVNPQIFDWLELQNISVLVLLIMMVTVAVINMTTALLILILERTNMIGILKALGTPNWSIRKVFLYNAGFILTRGLVLGNAVGLGICFLQKKFSLMSLDKSVYYVSTVPISIDIPTILLLDAGTLLICSVILILPSFIITRISPLKAIRFS